LSKQTGSRSSEMALFNTAASLRSLSNIIGDDIQEMRPYVKDALEAHKDDKETQLVLIHFYRKFDSEGAYEFNRDFSEDFLL
jgi:hypothetical protein